MNVIKTLLSGIIGTTTMTLYSYTIARKREKEFEEPVLLHKFFLRSMLPAFSKRRKEESGLDGWLLHYGAGFLFSTAYDRIWKETKTAPTIPAGIVLGAVSGLAGIAIWDLTFRMHPNPPAVDKRAYYKHLLTAHMVFGMFAALGYRLPEDEEDELERIES